MHFSRLVAALALTGLTLVQAAPGPRLRAASVIVQDQRTGEALLAKRADDVVPVASLTKLVTAMVLLDAKVDLQAPLTILEEDKDTLRHSRSRLPVGTPLTRQEALTLALMASENRAAHALGRTFPGGMGVFVAAMNAKARALGLGSARFIDPAGLSSGNVASAKEMARIVDAAAHYPVIRACSTREQAEVAGRRGPIRFHNTNALLQSSRWRIGLSKTGFIEESGQCLVMQAQVGHRPLLIVLLDANGPHSRFDDADRIRRWVEGPEPVVKRRVRRHRRA
ncbi:D-alanyl-D-alanine carboxypeptidase family protein [Mesoterricola sediminis]|nr:serine hydrolase [Mesoterricola sediminis]